MCGTILVDRAEVEHLSGKIPRIILQRCDYESTKCVSQQLEPLCDENLYNDHGSVITETPTNPGESAIHYAEKKIETIQKIPRIILQRCDRDNKCKSAKLEPICNGNFNTRLDKDHESEMRKLPLTYEQSVINSTEKKMGSFSETECNKENVLSKTDSETSDSDDSDDEEDVGISEYERMRLKNMKDNAKFFASLDIFKAKEQLAAINKPSPSISAKKVPREKTVAVPRRPSLRLRRQDPYGNPLPPKPVIRLIDEVTKREERKPTGPLEMQPTGTPNSSLEISSDQLKEMMNNITNSPNPEPKPIQQDVETFSRSFSKMKITPSRVAKVTKERIYSIAVHPSQDKVIVCGGDRGGRIGLWDVESRNDKNPSVLMFEPHASPVNCLHFCPADPAKLYSSSYDGTVRCGDFEKGVFDEVYASTPDEGIYVSHFDFLTPDGSQFIVAQNDGSGHVAVVDSRIGSGSQSIYQLHEKSIRTVSVHPVKNNYIATGSKDGTVALWDTRNLKRKKNKYISSFNQGRAVTAAYFSPLTGKKLLTTSYNDTIRVYQLCENGAVFLKTSIRHNNFVGRWLTCFRAVWHPQREDLFITGSMERPRRIEVFSDKGVLLKNFMDEDCLASVCSINAFHPTRNILVGGNSSGRLHVFM